ncbi:baseplate J/gp47 family protein [Priestia megaterium]|uniref:baseplate J/gp47 family protein n=1 Tax=Priestia megaterium TaxID=1404 RepID=UPI002E229CBF|nr:baseplate J/gp47 family protein [Priestia megaterium]
MAENDLTNKENIVTNYMRELARQEFPNLDLSDHGAFMEMFGVPHVKMLTPLLELADRVKLTQSLDNAELMTDQEMDELASSYFAYRNTGEYAVGTAVLAFDDLPANGVLQIPAGAEAESKQGYRFRASETIVLDETELPNYYDEATFLYRVPVFFEAENPGAEYNIGENELQTMVTTLSNLDSITNDASFTGGKDRETNRELADRIIETANTPNLGVERGWIRFAKSFLEVEDVIVAGYGHPLMQRDIVGVTPPGRFSSKASPEVHWGGKVDLHIRGQRLEETIETAVLQMSADGDLYVPLSYHPTHDIVEIEFTPTRATDPDLDASYYIVKDFLLMKDEDRETVSTLNEKSWVVIKDDRLLEGDTVYVRYRYNALIQDMNDELYVAENRPPASDVLLKEAKKKYIHSSMIIRLANPVTGLNEKDRSVLRQRLYNYTRELPTGGEIQFSDLTIPLYQNDATSIETTVDYISLPSQFLITDYDNKFLYYCLNNEKRAILEELEENSMYFAKWIPFFKDNVTLYDFFDVMHVLTYQNLEVNAWKTLSMRDHEWGKRVWHVDIAKRMLAYVNSIQRLSPAKWKTEMNDYFELGNLTIFDDVAYTPQNLEEMVNLFINVANPQDEEDDYENLLHLVVYLSVILYIITAENIGGMTTRDIFEWLIDLTKGTPIDYQVHH